LTKIPFFETLFSRNFRDASSTEVELPEDTPEFFANALEYAYFEKLPLQKPVDNLRNAKSTGYRQDLQGKAISFIKQYTLEDKLCYEKLENTLVDNYRALHEWTEIRVEEVIVLEENGPPNELLKLYAMLQMTDDMRRPDSTCDRAPDIFDEYLDKGHQAVEGCCAE
jgi:BTB/POZ domain